MTILLIFAALLLMDNIVTLAYEYQWTWAFLVKLAPQILAFGLVMLVLKTPFFMLSFAP